MVHGKRRLDCQLVLWYHHGLGLSQPSCHTFNAGYIEAILLELHHLPPRKPQYFPHPHIPIAYGKHPQLAEEPDDTAPLPTNDPIQPSRIIEKLLYYARAVDSTLSVALSALASEQNKPTLRTKRKILQLLDYWATNPNTRLQFQPSDMILYLHSDAGYNNESQACSRIGGHLYLGNKHFKPNINNGAILNPIHILRHVASSAADAKIGATFVNCCKAISLRTALNQMGYQQPPTQVTLGNTTAVCFVNRKIKQRRTKAIDMRYYWLQDQETEEKNEFLWKPSDKNLANYFTKHHPPPQHTSQLCVSHRTWLPTIVRVCLSYGLTTVLFRQCDRIRSKSRPASASLQIATAIRTL